MKNCRPGIPIPKFLLFIMRVAFLLFVVGVFQIYAIDSYAQKTQLTIHENEIELGMLFSKIEKQTDFYFFYSNDQINKNLKVSINVENKTIFEVLNLVLNNTGITYQVNNKAIILSLHDISITQTKQQSKRQITGIVKDERGEPIIGANIIEKGIHNGVITDIDGQFTISVGDDAVLQVSYLGYVSQEITVGTQSSVTIVMIEDLKTLEEVVVIGYGTQKRVNLTGSVASVNSEVLTKRQVGQTSLALQGVAPGVTVMQRSGQPGLDAGDIKIRGIGTLNNSNPLVLVDGLEMGINNIDVSTIESISVLKDAASSSIYGSKAANGVILITTKRASEGKFNISYSGYVAHQSPTNLPDKVK